MKYNEKEKCLKLTDKELRDCYRHISRAIYPTLERFAKERKESIDPRDKLLPNPDKFDYIAWTFRELATSESSPKNIKKDLIHGVIRPFEAEMRFKMYLEKGEAEYLSSHPNEIEGIVLEFLEKMYNQQIDLGLYHFSREFRNMYFDPE